MNKSQTYAASIEKIEAVMDLEAGKVPNLANIAAIIKEDLGFFWVGWYTVEGEELILGPFQGPLACVRIKYGRGVCGSSWKQRSTLVVPDVEEFPGHIACSSLSRSEIVVPVFKGSEVVAVLDIDSTELGTFDEEDARFLEQVCTMAARLF